MNLFINIFSLIKIPVFISSLLLVLFSLCLFLVPMFGAMPWAGPLLPVPPGEFAFVSFHTWPLVFWTH